MPYESEKGKGATLYYNCNPIGILHSIKTNYQDYNPSEYVTTYTMPKEINLTLNGCWFPDKLSKNYHLMLHGKSLRVRNKNKKIYYTLMRQLMAKTFKI